MESIDVQRMNFRRVVDRLGVERLFPADEMQSAEMLRDRLRAELPDELLDDSRRDTKDAPLWHTWLNNIVQSLIKRGIVRKVHRGCYVRRGRPSTAACKTLAFVGGKLAIEPASPETPPTIEHWQALQREADEMQSRADEYLARLTTLLLDAIGDGKRQSGETGRDAGIEQAKAEIGKWLNSRRRAASNGNGSAHFGPFRMDGERI